MSNSQIPYAPDSLFQTGSPRIYQGRQLDEIAFPLGGIGTGSISLGGWGQLRDFEIFNRPSKGLILDYSFFTLFAQGESSPGVCRVLQGPVGGSNWAGKGIGISRFDGAGLPHFESVQFEGAFPFARLKFEDPRIPLQISLEAYNPFIPLDPDDSGLPAALFHFDLKNQSKELVQAILFANLENKTGYPEVGGGRIEYYEDSSIRGLKLSTRKHPQDSPRYGTLALMTPYKNIKVQTHWYRGGWFDSLHRFWDNASLGKFEENRQPAEIEEGTDIGSIALYAEIHPGQSIRLPVWIFWHNPVFEKYWTNESPKPTWKNYYATRFEDAIAVARYVARYSQRLEEKTRAFAASLFSSTLPEPVLDAISSQLSVLKSTTCLRLEDGTFYGFEGCHPESGCCEGTCTHVWNYAQALAYLFPSLERSIREADYQYNLHEDGHMSFRMPLPLGEIPKADFHAAADGQLGGILKLYREWLISGDGAWLKKYWPKAQKALEYAWKAWDPEKEGVIRKIQHNTYDIEFHGPNTMIGSFYLGALRAAEEISKVLGDPAKAEEYHRIFESGRVCMDAELFNGEFFIQDIQPVESPQNHSSGGSCSSVSCLSSKIGSGSLSEPKYQYGKGCLSDQLIGQWYAAMLGLGHLFKPDHVRKALASIFKYNWKNNLREHANPQRIYALGREAGLLLATWPNGGRPEFPFPYSDEVWCGIEYQVASHLIEEGFLEEGLTIVKAVRDRHNGERRNPWNEFECGNHYARSLASYALLLALSGFHYSAPEEWIQFCPETHQDSFQCFFSVNSGWGTYRQQVKRESSEAVLKILEGELCLRRLSLDLPFIRGKVFSGKEPVKATIAPQDGSIDLLFETAVLVQPERPLRVNLVGS